MTLNTEILGPNVPRMGNAFTRAIGKLILKFMGWTLIGKLPNEKKAIIIGGPHTSNWDLPLAMGAMLSIGLKFTWMMKKEAFIWPFGTLWKTLGGLPIDRKAKVDVIAQVKTFVDAKDAVWLGLTPEGTRAKVERYKTGYLRMANVLNIPLFIVGIDSRNKTIILDKLWHPTGETEADNLAIKTYIETKYLGVRPQNQ